MKKFKMSKKGNIAIVFAIAIAFLMIIVLHQNQFANPQDELIKKCIASAIIYNIYFSYCIERR